MIDFTKQKQTKQLYTLKCFNIASLFETSKTINFPFVPNGKLMVVRCQIKHIRLYQNFIKIAEWIVVQLG